MKKYILLLALAFGFTGCGPQGPTPKELREQTKSVLNVQADSWKGELDFKPTAVDAYGNPLNVKVTNSKYDTHLTLSSSGPDGLPSNSDDITVYRSFRHTQPEPLSKTVDKGAESLTHGLFKGVVTGVKDGLKGENKKEK